MLFTRTDWTLVTPGTLAVQEPNVCAVRLSVAMPPAAGLVSTVALNDDAVQVTPVVPPGAETNLTVVPVLTFDVSTSPAATCGPPRLPLVRTLTASVPL